MTAGPRRFVPNRRKVQEELPVTHQFETKPLSASEVGEILGLQRDTVKKIPEEALPYFRANARGDRRYRRTDVEEYLARRRVG